MSSERAQSDGRAAGEGGGRREARGRGRAPPRPPAPRGPASPGRQDGRETELEDQGAEAAQAETGGQHLHRTQRWVQPEPLLENILDIPNLQMTSLYCRHIVILSLSCTKPNGHETYYTKNILSTNQETMKQECFYLIPDIHYQFQFILCRPQR